MIPKIGCIVQYTLSDQDAMAINKRRQDARDKMNWHRALETGAQVHVGNNVQKGDVFPMIISKCWGDTETSAINGSVFLDGNDLYWATSTSVGDGPGHFKWPAKE